MRFGDLIELCLNNLKRRKLRTLLTILGVVIGTTSVVIMLSLGFGINNLNREMYSQFGSMTQVNVSFYSYGQDADPSKFLTDETLAKFKKIPHVSFVSPKLSTQVIMKQGVYEANINLVGVTKAYMEQLKLGQGTLPAFDGYDLSMVMGNSSGIFFNNSKTNKGYWETGIEPALDYSSPFFTIFDTTAYYQSQNPSEENPVAAPKKYMMNACGKLQGSIDDYYSEDSMYIFVDVEALKSKLKKIYGKNPIPGQPTTKKGKPYNYFVYDSVVVACDDMENVMDVQKNITDMGYQAYSNMEWLEQTKETTNMIQAMLGGIGAVALLVAAIGIANTMMMSIYERTKEIGIMKVLGCDMNQIRNMFLMESGFIGFFGGIFGVGLSAMISLILNSAGISSTLMQGVQGDISQIPFWLYFAAVGFATVISMLAGLAPAMKAMRLSPLTAIRNE